VQAALRVASWNIRSAIGPGPFPDRWWRRIDADRLRAIGQFLGGLDAELVALQEVAVLSRDGQLVDNAGDLGRQLGMTVRYGAVRSFTVVEDGALLGVGCFGNAILSRRPPRMTRTVALPQAPDPSFVEPEGADHPAAGVRWADAPATLREPRCLLTVALDRLTVGTAHFSHVGGTERRLQAEATVAALEESRGPALLLGDLNAPIDAPELAPFRGWDDGFREPPNDPARVSMDGGFAIDHVLARGVTVERCEVVRESGALSDHYPLVAEIFVP
jgi:endonuclease/exonuclease/phosphatase family metal-dependent hydrolase